MEAKNFRIGNLVADYECEPHYFEIEELRKYVGSEIWAYYRKGSIKSKDCDPLVLTEDWLIRLGFVEKDGWFYKEKFSLGYMTTEQNLQAEWKISGVEVEWNLIDIKYVHELQNLFYSLCGKELEVKEMQTATL